MHAGLFHVCANVTFRLTCMLVCCMTQCCSGPMASTKLYNKEVWSTTEQLLLKTSSISHSQVNTRQIYLLSNMRLLEVTCYHAIDKRFFSNTR